MANADLSGLAITLDLGERVVIGSEASLKDRVASMREVPYRQGQQSGGAMVDPFLSFEAPGGPLWFELDSGNNGPVLIAPHAVDQLGRRGYGHCRLAERHRHRRHHCVRHGDDTAARQRRRALLCRRHDSGGGGNAADAGGGR